MSIKTLAICLVLLLSGARAEAETIGGNASLGVTSVSGNVALPASVVAYPAVLIEPAAGTSVEVFYKLDLGSFTAATLSSPALPPGGVCFNNVGSSKGYLAAITASGSATLRITQLTQCPGQVSGSSGGGTVSLSGNSGTPSQTAVSVGVTSTTVLAAAGATSFLKLCLAQSAANGIWVNWAGAAAVAAAPSEYMAPGQCDTWVKSTGYLPTSQINAIASAAVSVTLIHD